MTLLDTEVLEPIGYESITVSTSAVGFTAAQINPANAQRAERAFITVEGAAIRFRMDGNSPTSSEGHLLLANSSCVLSGQNALAKFKAIRDGGTDGTLKVTYSR